MDVSGYNNLVTVLKSKKRNKSTSKTNKHYDKKKHSKGCTQQRNTKGSSNFTNDEKKEQNKGPIRQNARRTTPPLSDGALIHQNQLLINLLLIYLHCCGKWPRNSKCGQ